MNRAVVAGMLAIAQLACVSHRTRANDQSDELARLRRDADALLSDVVALEARARALTAEWSEVRTQFFEARDEYARAKKEYDEAKAAANGASNAFRHAAEEWKRAEARWRLVTKLIVLAAAIDAANMDAAKAGGGGEGREPFDCTPVSTAKYREMLIAQGVSLVGMDIDHIVPRSLGGADNPSNYQVLPSSVNRSLGAAWGKDKCALAGEQCADAVAVSHECGSFRGGLP